MSTLEIIREKIRHLYETNPEVHMNVVLDNPRTVLKNTPAKIVGVYPYIFRIEESTVNFNRKDRAPAFCTYSDGVLTLSPVVLSDDRKMAEGGQEITISLPADAAVQVEPPRYHDFTEDQYHTNISLLKDSRNLDLL